jgi:nicotinamidase-related amidase
MRRFFLFITVVLIFLHHGELDAQQTALLLIDIQEFYFPGGRMQLENAELAGMNAGLVLEQFREEGLPVYHVRHTFEPGGNIHHYVKPEKGEQVFTKDQVNAFLGTGLLEALRQDSVSAVVICGMQTHMCIEAATRAAHDLGFKPVLVRDACATRAIQFEEYIIPATHVHYSTIRTLQGTYARIVTTDELLDKFGPLVIQ